MWWQKEEKRNQYMQLTHPPPSLNMPQILQFDFTADVGARIAQPGEKSVRLSLKSIRHDFQEATAIWDSAVLCWCVLWTPRAG